MNNDANPRDIEDVDKDASPLDDTDKFKNQGNYRLDTRLISRREDEDVSEVADMNMDPQGIPEVDRMDWDQPQQE